VEGRTLYFAFALGLLSSCGSRDRPPPPTAAASSTPSAENPSVRLAAPVTVGDLAGGEPTEPTAARAGSATCAEGNGPGASEAACGAVGERVANDGIERVVDPATGVETSRVGAELRGLESVSVRELLAHPSAYAGKSVRIEGNVTAMCHHRRAWFALQDAGDRAARTLRVFAAPAFLVPSGSIGRKARAEGTVELVDVPANTRSHLATEHGISDGEDGSKAVVLRATGAEFI
jgi:hypothetical protein